MIYWPWWLGGAALSLVFLMAWALRARPLGVSSLLESLLYWRENDELRRADCAFADEAELREAIRLATLEAFPEALTGEAVEMGPARRLYVRPSSLDNATFFLFLLVGGWLAAVGSGSFHWHWDQGETFARLFGNRWTPLFWGGVLVGVGTRMSGGCTSGHGLNGCASMQKPSLIATAVFFCTGIVVSHLLERW